VTGAGQLHSVVWTGKDTIGGLYLMRSNDDGKTWIGAKLPDTQGVHGDVTALNAKELWSVWDSYDKNESRILAARSCDGGTTWTTPQRLSQPSHNATHPKIVATSNGIFPYWIEQVGKNEVRVGMVP
jgi:hypothetical protein